MKPPLFTILIPTYNRGPLIAEAIDSVLAQKFDDIEIIVVDDGSTDGTAQIIQEYQGRVAYLAQENSGPGPARNLGIRHARGEYVVFLDSDDVQFPWTLRHLADAIREHDRPSAIATHEHNFLNRVELESVKSEPRTMVKYKDLYAFYEEHEPMTFPTGAVAVRLDVLNAVGGFAKQRKLSCEDIDLWLRIGDRAGFVHITTPPSYGMRRHEGNVSHNTVFSAQGMMHIISMEQSGHYPGGKARQRARRELITFIGRAMTVHTAAARELRWSWWLYGSLFRWNLKLQRWMFLLGMPLIIVRWTLASLLGKMHVCLAAARDRL